VIRLCKARSKAKLENHPSANQVMKTKLFLLAFVMLSNDPCRAQDNAPADDWKPAPSNQPGKEYRKSIPKAA